MCFYLFIYPSHMLFLSMCFTVPYLLVNYVRIKIYIHMASDVHMYQHTMPLMAYQLPAVKPH